MFISIQLAKVQGNSSLWRRKTERRCFEIVVPSAPIHPSGTHRLQSYRHPVTFSFKNTILAAEALLLFPQEPPRYAHDEPTGFVSCFSTFPSTSCESRSWNRAVAQALTAVGASSSQDTELAVACLLACAMCCNQNHQETGVFDLVLFPRWSRRLEFSPTLHPAVTYHTTSASTQTRAVACRR